MAVIRAVSLWMEIRLEESAIPAKTGCKMTPRIFPIATVMPICELVKPLASKSTVENA